MTLKLRSVGASDRGLIRSGNQDALHSGTWLVAVADGMGGMAAGDLASQIAIDAVGPLDLATPEDALVAALQNGIELATAGIREAVREDPERQGMGTTLTALLFARTGSCLALAHVGDSRAYLFREGVLKQITRDDTFVQMLVDQGVITADQAASHPAGPWSPRRCRARRSPRRTRRWCPGPATGGCCAATACPTWSARTPSPRCSAPTRTGTSAPGG